ncbi:MAG: hypothetical protein A3C47_04285 [Omnitrophica bacterium RIFCSPHIGHO2_02_FULL_51_18]|nr:MAG: hypothetical protein A3C47_04285 [Omnitrophica bacterium RIFCSPHIGHO2_02_FULL_51_18]
MNEQKRSEVLAFFWGMVSVLVFLALFSYTPDDIAYEVSNPNAPTRNFVGPAGAYAAWALLVLFGKTSYFLVPLFMLWAFAKWTGKKAQKLWLKIFSTVILLASSCALFSLVAQATDINRFQAGGVTGFFTAMFLTSAFGNAGIFVSMTLLFLSLILATELLVLQAAVGLFKKFQTWLQVLFPRKDLKASVGSKEGKPAPIPIVTPRFKEVGIKSEIKLSIPRPILPKAAEKPAGPGKIEVVGEEPELLEYTFPPLGLLQEPPLLDQSKLKSDLEMSSKVLEDTMRDFGIEAKVVEVEQGPVITRYELQPAAGVKVQRITSLENDIALAMRAASVRIIAPIPGKSRVGIEVPNSSMDMVYMKEVLASAEFQNEPSKITIALGKDTAGAPLVCNLADMPHLLIAGATNTGKSVCINSIIISILYKASPEDVKFIMIDPKMVELHFYNDLPHLICPVVTDKTKAPSALGWLLAEMDRRYKLLSRAGAKNILAFNEKMKNKEIKPETLPDTPEGSDEPIVVKKMPYILIVIDELADLMLSSQTDVENAITRLAQLARAVGLHMILATQRPSVDVITGVIKANFPARIAFQVASKVDSRTILDENGADKLLGRGDMLLMDPRKSKLVRGQGAWMQDKEIEKITDFIKSQRKPVYQENILQSREKAKSYGNFERDEVYDEAKRIVLETGQASVSMVQRRLGLGYTRAARLIDMMEDDGIVGPYRGAKPREILVKQAASQGTPKESP